MNEFIEKLIGRLEEEKQACHINAEVYTERKIEKIIEVVNELAEEYKGGWIPCEKELPKESGWYIVTFDNGIVNTFHWNVVSHNNQYKGIIAWQPLPEPYTEGEQA